MLFANTDASSSANAIATDTASANSNANDKANVGDNDNVNDDNLKILELPLRWAAARGRWPVQTETNMCEARLKPCPQCVYISLLYLMRLTITTSNIEPQISNTVNFLLFEIVDIHKHN